MFLTFCRNLIFVFLQAASLITASICFLICSFMCFLKAVLFCFSTSFIFRFTKRMILPSFHHFHFAVASSVFVLQVLLLFVSVLMYDTTLVVYEHYYEREWPHSCFVYQSIVRCTFWHLIHCPHHFILLFIEHCQISTCHFCPCFYVSQDRGDYCGFTSEFFLLGHRSFQLFGSFPCCFTSNLPYMIFSAFYSLFFHV